MGELQLLNKRLKAAKGPEDIFGKADVGTIKKAFRAMVMIAHEDANPPELKPLAAETVVLLNNLYEKAIKGEPSTPAVPVEIKSRKGVYRVVKALVKGATANVYLCESDGRKVVLTATRDPRDNDLAESGIKIMQSLGKGKMPQYFPQILDTFQITGTRNRAIVSQYNPDLYSISEIMAEYPKGVPVRHFGWMFNRILEGLWAAHEGGYINGAILPDSVLFEVRNHGVVLSEWSLAVKVDTPMKAIGSEYRSWYPPEVLSKSPAIPATDIYMAARCGIHLLGGNPLNDSLPTGIPSRVTGFLQACLIASPSRRPSDAGVLREEFGKLLREEFGAKRFVEFKMPEHE